MDKTNIITTDTAANMKAIFKYLHKDGCSMSGSDRQCDECFNWGPCICHILNLVVQVTGGMDFPANRMKVFFCVTSEIGEMFKN